MRTINICLLHFCDLSLSLSLSSLSHSLSIPSLYLPLFLSLSFVLVLYYFMTLKKHNKRDPSVKSTHGHLSYKSGHLQELKL